MGSDPISRTRIGSDPICKQIPFATICYLGPLLSIARAALGSIVSQHRGRLDRDLSPLVRRPQPSARTVRRDVSAESLVVERRPRRSELESLHPSHLVLRSESSSSVAIRGP